MLPAGLRHAFLLLWVIAPGAFGGERPAPSSASFTVSRLRAYLWHQEKSALGGADLLSGNVALWNTGIGEGGAGGVPAGAVMIVADLAGGFSKIPRTAVLVFEAKTSKRTLLAARVALTGFYSEQAKISVPIFLYEAPCQPLQVSVTVEGAGPPSRLSATAPFECGE